MKRAVLLYTVFALCIWGLNLRVAQLSEGDDTAVYAVQSAKTITAAVSRGYFYDRDYRPLVNGTAVHMAAVIPYDGVEAELVDNTDAASLALLQEGKPCIIPVYTRRVNTQYIRYFDITRRYAAKQSLVHTIGYLNADGIGVAGLEKSFETLLAQCSGELKVRFETDGKGQALPQSEIQLIDENYDSKGGVRLTIDADIQTICEAAAEENDLDKGAVLVLKSDTAEILAAVSVPGYDPENLAASLQDEDAPFLNRTLTSYSVGSVFKVITAAAALEKGISADWQYECTGSIEVGGIVFHCHHRPGHGLMDMRSAMENSCNPYFIALAQQVGSATLLSMTEALGLGEAIELADGFAADSGTLPDGAELQNAGGLANFAFGQGSLSATPLHMAAVYACIANGGVYHTPYLLLEQLNENGDSFARWVPEGGVRVMRTQTAQTLQDLLRSTVEQGSGQAAKPANGTAAGKTATAQSGSYEQGEEILRTWFCGYFPAEEPEYVVVVLKEEGNSPITDCAPIFRAIAEQLLPQASALEETGTTAISGE